MNHCSCELVEIILDFFNIALVVARKVDGQAGQAASLNKDAKLSSSSDNFNHFFQTVLYNVLIKNRTGLAKIKVSQELSLNCAWVLDWEDWVHYSTLPRHCGRSVATQKRET